MSGMGFNIRGGNDNQIYPGVDGIYVMAIRPKGTAYKQGQLQLYDCITEINGVNIENVSHRYALDIFRKSEICNVKVLQNTFSKKLKFDKELDFCSEHVYIDQTDFSQVTNDLPDFGIDEYRQSSSDCLDVSAEDLDSPRNDDSILRDFVTCVRIVYTLGFVSVLAIIGLKVTNEICRN